MSRLKTTAERGKFKNEISSALYKNADIRELLLGDTTGMSARQLQEAFKSHVKSHLFIDDTITETESFIFYDVRLPFMRDQTKTCQVVMYAMCHRDILDNYSKDGYYGNRADILSQMIEDTLINDHETSMSFGIGKLHMDSVDIYNSSKLYGCILTFSVPTFR